MERRIKVELTIGWQTIRKEMIKVAAIVGNDSAWNDMDEEQRDTAVQSYLDDWKEEIIGNIRGSWENLPYSEVE